MYPDFEYIYHLYDLDSLYQSFYSVLLICYVYLFMALVYISTFTFNTHFRGLRWHSGNTLAYPTLRSVVQTLHLMWESWYLHTNSCISWQFALWNLDQLYSLVSFSHKTTCCDMTYMVLKGMLQAK